MDINDYFRWYREDTGTIDYDYKLVQETIKTKQDIQKIKENLEQYKKAQKIKTTIRKTEKAKEEFFRSIQLLQGGEAKYLVASPPNSDTKQSIINYINNQKDWLELTITFMPMYRSVFTDYQIKNLLYHEVSKFKNIELILIPEYNKNNHLHYHGVIKGKPSTINKVKLMLSSYFGRTELKMIKYYNSYIEYMTKGFEKSGINYNKYIIKHISR